MFGSLHSLHHLVLAGGAVTNNIGNTKAGQAISGLISSGGTWVGGLGVAGGGLMVAYHAILRNFSGGDGATDAHHLGQIKKVIVGTAVVAGAGGLAHFAGGLF